MVVVNPAEPDGHKYRFHQLAHRGHAEQKQATRGEHAGDLGERLCGFVQVLEHGERGGQIELAAS